MIRLHSLGECLVDVAGTRIGPQQEVLFGTTVFLLLERRRAITRPEIIGHIWESAEARSALHRLRQTLYKLRSCGVQLAIENGLVRIVDPNIHVDFENLAEPAGAHGVADALESRLAGRFLGGYEPTLGPTFERWLEEKRDMVRTLSMRALLERIRVHRTRGDWKAAALWARQCLTLDPLNEEATLVLAEATALLGNKVRAVRVLEEYLDEIGDVRSELAIPARTLRRRIGQLPDEHAGGDTRVPLHGRANELATMDARLQGAMSGSGNILLVTGDEGIGKTRVCREFVRYAGLTSVWTADVSCAITDRARPFSSFADLVPRLLAAPGALGAAPATMASLALLTDQITTQNGADRSRHPDLVSAQIRASLTDLLASVAAEKTVLITFDDVHWLDHHSWRLLRELRAWIGNRRVLLLLSGRPSLKLHSLSGIPAGSSAHLQLRPLDRGPALALVAALLESKGETMPESVREWLVNASGGVPLLLHELARHGPPSSPQEGLPRSYVELLSRRLAQLSSAALRTLQVVALLDGQCTLGRLEAALTPADGFAGSPSILRSLEELDGHDLLTWTNGIVSVASRAIGEAAIAQLSPLLKATLHHRIATLLEEAIEEGNRGPALWACAEHWRQAGDPQRSIALLRSCARRALAVGGASDAADMLQEALENRPPVSERLPVLIELSRALHLAGQMKQALPVYTAIRQLRSSSGSAAELHDDVELASFLARWRGGEQVSAVLTAVRECAHTPFATPNHRVSAASFAVMCADNTFDAATAEEIAHCVQPLLESPELDAIASENFLMVFHCVRGDLDQAARAARRLLSLGAIGMSTDREITLMCHSGDTLAIAGFPEEAHTLFERSFALAQRTGIPSAVHQSAYRLQRFHLTQEHLDESECWAERFEAEQYPCEIDTDIANHYSARCRVAIARRDWGAAQRFASLASDLLTRNGSARSSLYHSALHLRIQHERDDYVASEEQIHYLLTEHERAKIFSGHDFVMETLFLLLDRVGQTERANRLTSTYLSRYRRERTPIPSYLTSLCQDGRRRGH